MLGYEKTSFLHLPTPLEYLSSLSEEMGIKLYIKRDDLTGLGMGGNKLRKLEYFIKDAMDKGCTAMITVGGAQTNHGRLTAAVAAKYGLKCTIVSADDYPGEVSANILLDRLMGADVVLHKGGNGKLTDTVEKVTKNYEAKGDKVYFVPMGGSNELGALGYYECAKELAEQIGTLQLPKSRVLVTVGSMGTYMGLFCGLHHTGIDLTGVLIGPFYEDTKAFAVEYFEQVKKAWELEFDATAEEFDIREEYVRGGYNNPVKEVREGIYEMARKEAILLDPCYTGKTYAALKDMVAAGEIKQGETVIFIHTGGAPGLNSPQHRQEMERELIDGITII